MSKKKIVVNMPELREVIDEILRLKKDEGWNQTILGDRIGMNQSMVSKMRYGPDWEMHWKVFWRLLAICEELGFDPARDLKHPSDKEVLDALHHTATRGHATRRKKGHETPSAGSFPPRRIAGGSRNDR